MTDRERAINQDLHVLDEAHRLGRITRAEYRARRRRVLGSLYDSSGVVTAQAPSSETATLINEEVPAALRGPMGLPELTSTKWIVRGTGQVRA